jgi:putative endopeptidase
MNTGKTINPFSALAFGLAITVGLAGCRPGPDSSSKVGTGEQVQLKMLGSGLDLRAIDGQVRPQDDFFHHVNGQWLKDKEIPVNTSSYGVFEHLFNVTQGQLKKIIQEAASTSWAAGSEEQKLGDMYRSYMNEELANSLGLTPLQGHLNDIAAIENMQQMSAKLGELIVIGVGGPFNFYVWADAKDPELVTVYLYQGGLTLPDREYYAREEDQFVNLREATQQYISEVLAKAGHASPTEAAAGLMKLEKDIATRHSTKVDNRDPEKNYQPRSPEQVQVLLGDFDWPAYALASGLGDVKTLVVRNLEYFEAAAVLFNTHKLQVWKDYLSFKLIDAYASRLSQDLVDLHFNFHSTVLKGIPEQRPRWRTAVTATSMVLGEVLGQHYVERHFPPQAKAKIQAMLSKLKQAYAQSIRQLTWMSAPTKVAALKKLSKFKAKIGYPDKWHDDSKLVIEAGDLVGNYIRYATFDHQQSLDKLVIPLDKAYWAFPPQTINAFYSPLGNEIIFPAGILQAPLFDMQADDALNYGAIGAIIAHEITHGFDDQGSKYDGDGQLRNWWTDQDRAAFERLTEKLRAQFDKFEPIEGHTINGRLTLGENIGDLAGLSIAYKAYQLSLNNQQAPIIDGLSGAQRFFMGYAQAWRGKVGENKQRALLLSDPHSPNEFRVNGIIGHIQGFYPAFDVKPGDGMYLRPQDRVKIW